LITHPIAHRSAAVERSELAAVLGDVTDGAAVDLRLAELREALGDRLLTAGSSLTMLVPPDAWVDVAVAEQAALSLRR
jgi:hypothetical protein